MTYSLPTTHDGPAVVLFDAQRGISYVKPRLRGWMHLVVFEASLVVGTLLIASTHGATQVTGVAIYVGCVSGLFGVSALYHRANWSPRLSRRIQRLDHAMIFLLIAGTATPCYLIGLRGTPGVVAVAVLWSITLLALGVRLVWMDAPEKLAGGVFIGLGVVAGAALPAVWSTAGAAAGALILSGGVLYIVGALGYHWRRPNPKPTVFGYHEVFHAYVSVAAACQFVAIFLLS